MRALIALAALIAAPAHGQTYGPPDTVEAPPHYERITAQPSQSDRDCVRKWRGRAMLAHAADAATTVAAIETNRGREGNPLARMAFGKNVTSGEFVAFKLGMVGIFEGLHSLALAKGDYAGVCRSYKITAIVIGGVAALNLRVHF